MRPIKIALWGFLAALTLLWLLAETPWALPTGVFGWRTVLVQYTGLLAIGSMSLATLLALRPRWPERPLQGLDKMYRLHRWLGIAALTAAVIHWLWAQGVKWAVGFGWLARPHRGPRPSPPSGLEGWLAGQRGWAEQVGEWAFYAVVVLILIALIRRIPYHWFYKTHRLIAVAYLVLVYHALVLVKFSYWTTPLGVVLAVLLAGGAFAAVVSLFGGIGARRRVAGKIVSLQYYRPLRVLEMELRMTGRWPGHQAGQFAFMTADPEEGPHPFTIASSWEGGAPTILLIAKELGDYTRTLPQRLHPGQAVTLEGPYGRFTFDDGRPQQIWIGAGIGITPFIAAMKRRAAQPTLERAPQVDLFHTTADYDPTAIAKLRTDAEAAGVRLHLLVDARDGYLTGERVRVEAPEWREAGIWFCGPPGFGAALRKDFAGVGFPVAERFHQELFELRG